MRAFTFIVFVIFLSVWTVALCEEPREVNPGSTLGRRVNISINRLMPKTLECYNVALKSNPDLSEGVKIKMKITVNSTGEALSAETAGEGNHNADLVKCIKDEIMVTSWPSSEKPYFCHYTFSFAPDKEK